MGERDERLEQDNGKDESLERDRGKRPKVGMRWRKRTNVERDYEHFERH